MGLRTDVATVVACYHSGMTKKVTTVRMPEDLADEVEAVARGRGVSINTVVIAALAAEIDRVKADKDFMAHLRALTERDREILDRLAQ
jgi:predicted transcriptional regulator